MAHREWTKLAFCSVCRGAIEMVFGQWYHIDHHQRVSPYDHQARP